VRGAVTSPDWHSIRVMLEGPDALHCLYSQILPDDIPFAEDCVGDQFCLRSSEVIRLQRKMVKPSLRVSSFTNSWSGSQRVIQQTY